MQNDDVLVQSCTAAGAVSSEETAQPSLSAVADPSEGSARTRLDLIEDLKERRAVARSMIEVLGKHKQAIDVDKRFHMCMIEFYPDSTPFELVATWVDFIRDTNEGLEIAGAIHDRDLKADGSPKKTHLHLAWNSKQARTPSAWCSWLANTGCPLSWFNVTVWDDKARMFRYLLHKGFPEKAQYDNDALLPWSDDISKYVGRSGGIVPDVSELQVFLDALHQDNFKCVYDVVCWSVGTFMEPWVARHYGLIRRCIEDYRFFVTPYQLEDEPPAPAEALPVYEVDKEALAKREAATMSAIMVQRWIIGTMMQTNSRDLPDEVSVFLSQVRDSPLGRMV